MNWDPAHYLRFADHRRRPGITLLNRINAQCPAVVVEVRTGRPDGASVKAVARSALLRDRVAPPEQYPEWLDPVPVDLGAPHVSSH